MVTAIATLRRILQYPPDMFSPQQKYDRPIPEYLSRLLLGVALFSPLIAFADVPAIEVKPAAIAPESSFVDAVLNAPHDYMAEQFVSLASGVDEFFGNDRNFQESNKSVLQFDLTHVMERNGSNNTSFSYKAKLHFPTVQNRLNQFQKYVHLLLESNPDQSQNLPGGTGTAQQRRTSLFREVTAPDSYGAALRFENREDSRWRLSADGGLKLDNISVVPFVRSRAGYTIGLGVVELKWAESLFWFNTIGAGENTQFDADYHFSDPLLFRATSGATWMHDKQNFDLHQDFSLYHTLDERNSLLYQLSANGVSNPQAQVSEYAALIRYRQRLHRDWVFVELSPQLHYPRIIDYQLNAQFIARLEILFAK